MRDLPWIGNPDPHDPGRTYTMSDFEEGALVRNALARAIDRERINQDLLHGPRTPRTSEPVQPEESELAVQVGVSLRS